MKNNIKNNLTSQKFLLLRENCEKYLLKNKNITTRISLISFFSSTNPIKNIYIDLAFNAYNKSFHINMLFLIFFLISQVCQIIYSFIDIDKSDPVRALTKYIIIYFFLPKYPSTILPIINNA